MASDPKTGGEDEIIEEGTERKDLLLALLAALLLCVAWFIIDNPDLYLRLDVIEFLQAVVSNIIPSLIIFIFAFWLFRREQRAKNRKANERIAEQFSKQVQAVINTKLGVPELATELNMRFDKHWEVLQRLEQRILAIETYFYQLSFQSKADANQFGRLRNELLVFESFLDYVQSRAVGEQLEVSNRSVRQELSDPVLTQIRMDKTDKISTNDANQLISNSVNASPKRDYSVWDIARRVKQVWDDRGSYVDFSELMNEFQDEPLIRRAVEDGLIAQMELDSFGIPRKNARK